MADAVVEEKQSQLVALNVRMLDAEQRGEASDIEYLSTVLADDLVFRRADGSVVDKATFLQGVPSGARRLKERRAIDVDAHVLGPSALVTLTVVAVDDSGGKRDVKAFKNVRFFVERDNRWFLQHWYNSAEPVTESARSEG